MFFKSPHLTPLAQALIKDFDSFLPGWLATNYYPKLPLPHFYSDLSGGSDDKESACNAGDLGLIPESGISLKRGMTTHTSILAWRMSWAEEPGLLQSLRSQRVGHDWATNISASNTSPVSQPTVIVKNKTKFVSLIFESLLERPHVLRDQMETPRALWQQCYQIHPRLCPYGLSFSWTSFALLP